MDVEGLLLRLDRVAGGRWAAYRVEEVGRSREPVRRGFRQAAILLAVVLGLAVSAVAEAGLLHEQGNDLATVVWGRLVVILGLSLSLFYFLWRASRGWWWAYSRLRLFSLVFPVVAVATCAIPGLYPEWMVVEQLAVAAVLLLLAMVLSSPAVATVYARPPGRPGSPGPANGAVPPDALRSRRPPTT